MMAELARLVVRYEGEAGDAPASFVAKFASQNETNREIALSYKLYERETRFLVELDPQTGIRTPHTFFSGTDEDRFLILMEDMTDYEIGSQVDGATFDESGLAVDELARLHAAFWDGVEDLDWVPRIANSYHAGNMKSLAAVGFDAVVARFGDLLPEHLPPRRDALLGAIDELQARMDTRPITLCHGDFRMANLLFGSRPGQAPIVLLDWQGPLRGRGITDVALFLAQSTLTEVRRQHERTLLRRYIAGLTSGGVTGLTEEAVWQDYRQAILHNWIYAVVVGGTLDSSNDMAYAWMARMVERQAAASDDLRVFDLLP
jgi:hypothetical protein